MSQCFEQRGGSLKVCRCRLLGHMQTLPYSYAFGKFVDLGSDRQCWVLN